MKVVNPGNICKGFSAAGVYPLNRDIFCDSDFMSSEVTNRPMEVSMEPLTSPLPPLPKAPPRKSNTKRKRTKTTILTATPEKALEDNQPSKSRFTTKKLKGTHPESDKVIVNVKKIHQRVWTQRNLMMK